MTYIKRDINPLIKLGVYVPSFGRRDIALSTVKNLCQQAQILNIEKHGEVEISVILRCNDDPTYNSIDFTSLGCTFLKAEINEGADANIAFGFFYANQQSLSHLWIVGDEEYIPSTALKTICSILLGPEDFDAIIGSKNKLGVMFKPESSQQLYMEVGTTTSFISSTIYSCKFNKVMCEQAFRFSFTGYSHLAMQNMLIQSETWNRLRLVDIQSLVDYHAKVVVDPLKPRAEYGMRDSFVFFGKILATLASGNQEYTKSEFSYWWRENWHRVSMYLSKEEPNGWAVICISLKYKSLFFLVLLGMLPWWKIKELIRPVSLSRSIK